MDHHHLGYVQGLAQERPSSSVLLVYGIVLLYLIHQALVYFDFPVLFSQELLWNALVYILPKYLLLDRARRQELKANGMLSQTHAAKGEALRRMLGIGGNTLLQSLPIQKLSGDALTRTASTLSSSQPTSKTLDVPPGLGNWDNSCYQNSVLQGLTAVDSLRPYLNRTSGDESSTTGSLLETISKLKDARNNGTQLWTPAKLKNMSSWQQQDAQEYFSKVMDELDKDATKLLNVSKPKPGLERITEEATPTHGMANQPTTELEGRASITLDQRNPMDGLLAQRVSCTRCGFSEGLSMIPFNCLTVPLGSDFAYDLEECLDEYTKLEEISDVECAKCTLLRAEKQLSQMLPPPPAFRSTEATPALDSKVLALPPELRAEAFKRLSAIQKALEDDDFADKTLDDCQIPKKARVSSIKTRQAVIGRPPKALVVHVNRSVFDEMTGVQRKNYASVRYPLIMNLQQWMLDSGLREGDDMGESQEPLLSADLSRSDSETRYLLKAVVTHYGRHENGHYICYRRHEVSSKQDAESEHLKAGDQSSAHEACKDEQWWRLSDEDVSPVTEDDVLAQGGVFMLFYERETDVREPAPTIMSPIASAEAERVGDEPAGEVAGTTTEPDVATVAVGRSAESKIEMSIEDSRATTTSPPASEPASQLDGRATTPSTEATTENQCEAGQELPATPQKPTEATTGTGSKTDQEPPPAMPKPQAAPLMRTARGRQTSRSEKSFAGNALRAVAAT